MSQALSPDHPPLDNISQVIRSQIFPGPKLNTLGSKPQESRFVLVCQLDLPLTFPTGIGF
jgi:hypothetical protein